jgi:hypothetical protein
LADVGFSRSDAQFFASIHEYTAHSFSSQSRLKVIDDVEALDPQFPSLSKWLEQVSCLPRLRDAEETSISLREVYLLELAGNLNLHLLETSKFSH